MENTLYYDGECSLCFKFASFLKKIFNIKILDANKNTFAKQKMLNEYTWIYKIDGKVYEKADVMEIIFKRRKYTKFFSMLLSIRLIKKIANIIYAIIAKNRCRKICQM